MKKILHIQVLPKLSGVQKVSLEILKGLPDSEYEKWILFSNVAAEIGADECVKSFEKANVTVLLSSYLKRNISLKDLSAFVEIYKLCRKEKFDIVHTHSTKPGFLGRIAATLAGTRLVIHTVHGVAFHKYVKFPIRQFYWMCEMFASLFCDRIIIVNRFYTKYFKWFKKKTSTVYNGINTFIDYQKELAAYEKNELIKILFVGRLDTQKDPLTLLNAAKIVCRKYPQAQFTLVGDGEKMQECKDWIVANNMSRNIMLEGWQANIASYYQSHNIFAMSSIYESFGLVFLEAGYYKLPVVTTNVEGIPEVVINGETGLLSPPQNPEMMAKNIIQLIENKELRNRMGEAAYKRVITHFSVERMVDNYKRIYSI